MGEFLQRSLILGCDDDQPLAQTEVKFALPELNSLATNVHMFGGLQFPKHGLFHIEIRLRFPLPVVPVTPRANR